MTNLRKLILMALLALPLSLAVGCGDDDSNGNGDGDGNGDGNGGGGSKVDPTSHCTGGAEAWKLTALTLDADKGFNLDNHVTVSKEPQTPENGCGVLDGTGGVEGLDNSFAAFIGNLESIININEIVADALAEGDIEVMAFIRGYEEGGANDNIELTLLINNMEYPELKNVKAKVEDGKIVAELDRLPLTLDGIEIALGEDPVPLSLTINILKVRVEIDEPGAETSTVAILGGGVQYDGDGGLKNDLLDLIAGIGLDALGPEEVDQLIASSLDLSSNGTDCDTLSLGAEVEFEYDTLCE